MILSISNTTKEMESGFSWAIADAQAGETKVTNEVSSDICNEHKSINTI